MSRVTGASSTAATSGRVQFQLDDAALLLQLGDCTADRFHLPSHEILAFIHPGSARAGFAHQIGLPDGRCGWSGSRESSY